MLRPKAYVGTPSFLKIIIEKAQEMGEDIRSVRYALVGAEALPESLRQWFAEHGVAHVYQTYASADVGSMAYETRTGGKLNPGMVLDEDVILEIVRPGSGAADAGDALAGQPYGVGVEAAKARQIPVFADRGVRRQEPPDFFAEHG